MSGLWDRHTWMRCLVSTATGLPSLMLSVNQPTSNTCMSGRFFKAHSLSHFHRDEAWLSSETTWVMSSLQRTEKQLSAPVAQMKVLTNHVVWNGCHIRTDNKGGPVDCLSSPCVTWQRTQKVTVWGYHRVRPHVCLVTFHILSLSFFPTLCMYTCVLFVVCLFCLLSVRHCVCSMCYLHSCLGSLRFILVFTSFSFVFLCALAPTCFCQFCCPTLIFVDSALG